MMVYNNLRNYSKFLLIAFCMTLSVFAVTHVYWGKTFPYTHDGENHLARFASYKLALREGHFPPRISPNLMNRYGYPVFNFNYPLANILSVPASIIKIPYENIFSIQVVIAMTLAWFGIFYGLKLSGKKLSEMLLFASIYLSTPYISTALLFRGTIGEIWAYALLPWVWVSTFWIQEMGVQTTSITKTKIRTPLLTASTVLVWSSFMLAHNVTLLLSIPFVIALAIYQFGTKKKLYLLSLKLGVLAFCLVAWFWIPAYLEKNQTVLADAQVNTEYTKHFLSLDTLFFSSHSFGYSLAGHSNTFAPSFGLPLVLVSFYLAAAVAVSFIPVLGRLGLDLSTKKTVSKNGNNTVSFVAVPLFITTTFFAFLTLPSSQFFVTIFPLLTYVQFPWRWLLLLPIAAIVTFSTIKKSTPTVLKMLLLGAVLIQFLIIMRSTPADRFHRPNQYYEYYTMSTSTLNENLPKTFLYPEISIWEPSPIITTGTAASTVQYWKGSSRKYTIDATTDVTILEPTMYFSGWRTVVKNLETNNTYAVKYIDSIEIGGRIAYTLPSGTYQVHSYFSDSTLPRIAGNTLSILAMIFCIQWIGRWILRYKNKTT